MPAELLCYMNTYFLLVGWLESHPGQLLSIYTYMLIAQYRKTISLVGLAGVSPQPASFYLNSLSPTYTKYVYFLKPYPGVLGSYDNTPRRRVLATAVRAPVSFSLSHFSFSFPVSYLETMTEPVLHNKVHTPDRCT